MNALKNGISYEYKPEKVTTSEKRLLVTKIQNFCFVLFHLKKKYKKNG